MDLADFVLTSAAQAAIENDALRQIAVDLATISRHSEQQIVAAADAPAGSVARVWLLQQLGKRMSRAVEGRWGARVVFGTPLFVLDLTGKITGPNSSSRDERGRLHGVDPAQALRAMLRTPPSED